MPLGHPPWFFVESMPTAGGVWWLSRDEAKHATGAKRLGPGDPVVLFDGSGQIAEAALGSERSREGTMPVTVHGIRAAPRVGRIVHLACAIPKGDRLSTLIDMTTQLGVASFTPLRCERSVVGESEHRSDRAHRIQIEACKQSRNAWLPALRHETNPRDIVRSGGTIVVAHPGGVTAEEIGHRLAATPAVAITLCIGPEGGFTDAEIAAFRAAGAMLLDLGASVLRIETAAVVATALLR